MCTVISCERKFCQDEATKVKIAEDERKIMANYGYVIKHNMFLIETKQWSCF